MPKFVSSLIFLSMLCSSLFAADPKDFRPLTQTPGMDFYHPEYIFSGRKAFSYIPEMRDLNSQTLEDLQKTAWFLASNGIAVGLGDNPTRDSQFDLYNPVSIDIGKAEPAAEFSMPQDDRQAEMGKWHFGTHDAWHMAYIPGPRLSDIATPQKLAESKKKMVDMLLLIESVATTLSASRHAKWYWNWRNRQSNAHNIEEFEARNRGLYSVSTMTEGDFFDIIKAVMFGDVGLFARTWNQHFDPELYQKARAAGVPMLFPSLKPKLGEKGEILFLKYGFGFVAGLANYLAPASSYGHKSFKAYAGMQADYYLQSWYVKWADMFQIGLDFDAASEVLNRKVEQIKTGRVFEDVTKPVEGQFEVMHTKNATEQFGRKIIELIELARLHPGDFSPEIVTKLNSLLTKTHAFHQELMTQARAFKSHPQNLSAAQVEKYQASFLKLVATAETHLPIDSVLPKKLRLPLADYSTFWRDAYGVVIPRPAGMVKFLSARGVIEAARKQRAGRMQAEIQGRPAPVVNISGESIDAVEQRMGLVYDGSRKGSAVARTSNQKTEYLNALATFQEAFAKQALEVFLPQMREFGQISIEERKQLHEVTEGLVHAMNARLDEHKALYEKVLLNQSATPDEKARFLAAEADLKWVAEKTLHMMADTLELSDFGKPTKALAQYNQVASSMTASLNQKQTINPSIKDLAYHLMPNGKSKIKAICSLITRMCMNQKIGDIIKSISLSNVARKDTDIAKAVAGIAPLNIPANAAIVFVMNHDNAIGDIKLVDAIAKKLGVSTHTLLTTRYAWPQTKFMRNRDERALFVEEHNLAGKITERLQKDQKNPAVTIYPEGNSPFWSANFPLAAKAGAFAIARRAAVKLAESSRPVYLVRIISNYFEHTTSADIPLTVKVSEPVLVPSGSLQKNDPWVDQQRLSFENEVSALRGLNQVDLISRTRVEPRGVWTTAPVQTYVPGVKAMDVVGERWKAVSCSSLTSKK